MDKIKEMIDKIIYRKKKSINHEIVMVTYVFVGLFVLVLARFTYFLMAESADVINNPYNQRQDLLAERIDRGKIVANKGEVLAQTIKQKDGKIKREYPYNNLFTHAIGRFTNGKTGIELTENFHLLTSSINPLKKIMNELAGEKNPGDTIATTLDVNLQKVAYDALGNYKGAIIVMEPDTGKILAMVSKPDYNPNLVSSQWDSLVEDSQNNSALINRATQGLYPPGSTFKILTALEYIKENKNYKKYHYACTGSASFGNMKINCYNKKVHGEENLETSFAKSCNTSFANIGTKLNKKQFKTLCETFLFNRELPTNITYNKSSFVLNNNSDIAETTQTVIGQGKTQITPFHNALITAAIANGGILMKPYLVDHIENQEGNVVKKYLPSTYDTLITTKEASIMTSYMETVVEDGTAYALKNMGYSVAGKTGSAEFDSGNSSHAWFVGFAPSDKPKLVVSIIVEGAGTGSDYAVPIAKKIFQAYFQ